jgi:hypothetical protein
MSPETVAVTVCPSVFLSELIESCRRARICVPAGSALAGGRAFAVGPAAPTVGDALGAGLPVGCAVAGDALGAALPVDGAVVGGRGALPLAGGTAVAVG